MIKIKTILAAAILLSGFAAQRAHAQEATTEVKEYPYVFIGIQGGGQTTFTNYSASKLITPIGAVSVGGMFSPAIGARLHVSGINEKGGLKSLDETYDYKFVTSNIDVLINLCNVFAPNKHHTVNAYLIGGVGLSYAWDNDDLVALSSTATETNLIHMWDDDRITHNFRVGAQLEVDVARWLGVNLEVTANNLHDRFNSKYNGHGDWQVQGLIGLNFKFGRKKVSKPAPVPPPPPAPAPEPQPMPAPAPPPAPEPEPEPEPEPQPKRLEETRVDVFFEISQTEPAGAEATKVANLAQWLKDHPSANVSVVGYADAGTGTSSINKELAQQRANSVSTLLTDKYGIDGSRVTTGSCGDTVQPYSDPDSNRVVISIAKETE